MDRNVPDSPKQIVPLSMNMRSNSHTTENDVNEKEQITVKSKWINITMLRERRHKMHGV